MRRIGTVIALAAAACGQGTISGGGGSADGSPVGDEPGDEADAGEVVERVPGLTAQYFFRYREAVLERVDPGVDFNWAMEAPAEEVGADWFSVRWTGELEVPTAGTYGFATASDDGVRLWIDGELVIDDWALQGVEENRVEVALEAGPVPIRLDYFEAHSPAEVHLRWTPPGGAEEIIPTEALWTAAPAAEPPPTGVYQNPVVPTNCPDPGVIAVDGMFYAVCTGGKMRIRRSHDLVFWEDTDAFLLPDGKAAWSANGGRNWAPEIHKVGDKYVAYFTAVNGANVLSIGAASADDILGPYVDRGGPLVERAIGVIDATYFRDDDGKHYLFYKIDGNSQGQRTPTYARELAPDGLSFAPGSQEVQVLTNDPGTWEGGVTEAAWIVKRDGYYYLFYSGNVYDHRYRTGVARATSILGPYEKHGAPILGNNERWVGPGHGSVLEVAGTHYFVYHAWDAAADGTNAPGGRKILVDRIEWGADGWPRIHDGTPSRSWLPWPDGR